MNCHGKIIEEQIASLEKFLASAEKMSREDRHNDEALSHRMVMDFKRSLAEFRRMDAEHKNSCRDCRVEEVA